MLELVRDELTELFQGNDERFGHEVVSMEIATDHVHLFLEADPKWSPAEIAKQFKGYSGRTILKRHPEIKHGTSGEAVLWKDGYYGGTTGAVSKDVVRRYIEETDY
jgi:putative transposase